MEVIYRDSSKRKVNIPKNVRQIGTEDGKLRIYIEDYAYSFIKDITIDEDEDGAVGILMGEVQESDGIKYIFIKGVVEVTNAAVFTDHIAFTSETWPVTRKYINAYFGDYDIMGWYLCSSKINDKNMDIINKADKENFDDKDNVFFMVNSTSGDEAFFAKGKKGLTPVSGYTVYFEKNTAMQRYMKEMQSDYEEKYTMQQNTEEESKQGNPKPEKHVNGGQYRNIAKENKVSDTSVKRNLTLIYAFSMLIIIVVLVIGVNKINSYDKLSGLGETESAQANATPQEQTSKTPVTTLDGNVTQEPTTQESTTQEPTTEEPTTQEPTTQEPTTEEPTTKAEQTYVIQANDTMWSLCVKFYGAYSETAANKILSYNNMTINDLQVGRTIKIPSE